MNEIIVVEEEVEPQIVLHQGQLMFDDPETNEPMLVKFLRKKTIENKQAKFVDEYMIDLNATQAAKRAGYSKRTAYAIGCNLLKHVEIRAEIGRRLLETKITGEEIIARLGAMARGEVPTKVTIFASGAIRKDFDTIAAVEKIARLYSMFVDTVIIDLDGLNITVDDE